MTFIQRNQQNSLFGSQSWTSCSLPCASSSPEVQSRWCRGWLSLTSTVKRVTFPGAWKWRFRQYHIRIESLYILLTFLLWRSTKIFANLCHWKHFLYLLRTEKSLRTRQWVLYLVLPIFDEQDLKNLIRNLGLCNLKKCLNWKCTPIILVNLDC